MTHEFKSIIRQAVAWQNQGKRMVLATVVALEGSSYRRPGVRMLLADDGNWVGAVSGGCVEKEVYRYALRVFESGKARVMSYDGTYRLGCEGTLYLLLEPFEVGDELLKTFESYLSKRQKFSIESAFNLVSANEDSSEIMGSEISLGSKKFTFQLDLLTENLTEANRFSQEFPPLFQLCIFGAEHDAVALCQMASNLGWEVHIYASPDEQKTQQFFPGSTSFQTPTFEALDSSGIDSNTAVMLMTHSFNKDVQYLMALKDARPAYFGLLGPAHRRERLLSKFLEYFPETDLDFFEKMHGPAGINIGAENAYEIAVSILAEILSVLRDQDPQPLKDKSGRIHA
ncbi:XdhC family protein [Algoriphagus namhaensis]|uniref:XdhC family protein n=1 Tax=Algoriphagus namhaensis TaxID=915353 RepID=A0ABV8ARZ5_9BACT